VLFRSRLRERGFDIAKLNRTPQENRKDWSGGPFPGCRTNLIATGGQIAMMPRPTRRYPADLGILRDG
jgi:hypothetical protein